MPQASARRSNSSLDFTAGFSYFLRAREGEDLFSISECYNKIRDFVDMRRACDHAINMPRMIQIRNVPDEVHRKLKVRAAKEGVTLSELLAREARRLAEEPKLTELREYFLSRPRWKLRPSAAVIIRQERDRR